jgi:RND family efflux transporter MFP subunit
MKNKYIIIASLLALTGLWSCHKNDTKSKVIPLTNVNIEPVKIAVAVYYDDYQGTVTAINTVELRSQVAGFITGIFFKEGDVVPQGKALYEIDRRKYVAAYNQAEANLLSAQANEVKSQKDVDRYNMLLQNDAIARQTVDQATAAYAIAKAGVAVAQAGVASAKTDLSFATITAPFTGRIGISQVRLGSQVSPGSTLLNTISSEHPIGVDVVINEQDIARFYKFQQNNTDSTFKLQLTDGTLYSEPGKVLAIDRGVNSQTGTVTVRLQFDNKNDLLKDGMSCVLKVLNSASGVRMQVPYKAISEQMGEFFVFVYRDTSMMDTTVKHEIRDTVAKQHKVKLGPRIGSNVVVLSGLREDDKVITDGFQRLRDGGKIKLGMPAKQGTPGAAPAK